MSAESSNAEDSSAETSSGETTRGEPVSDPNESSKTVSGESVDDQSKSNESVNKTLAHQRIIAALDLPTANEATAFASELKGAVGLVKIGLELFVSEGPAVVAAAREQGLEIFLDLKLHDIPNTVEQAAKAAGRLGVRMLTVHASGGAQMIAAAKRGVLLGAEERGHPPPILLAVTVLTSMNERELPSLGVSASASEQVLRLGELAIGAGADGLVCSAHEIRELRKKLGTAPVLVVPGIRPAGGAAHDQARVATPAQAVEWGADYLVIGRPIREAAEPKKAAAAIAGEIARAQPGL